MTRTLSVGGNQGRGDPCIRATAMHRIPELQTECGGEYVANGEGFPMAEQQASDDRSYWLLFLAVSAVFALITLIAAVTAYPNLR
jgi:hypothetical protein